MRRSSTAISNPTNRRIFTDLDKEKMFTDAIKEKLNKVLTSFGDTFKASKGLN